jgi:hypothetical protein
VLRLARGGCDDADPPRGSRYRRRDSAPATGHGFLVGSSYGYGKAMERPDGSLLVTYIATGGHRTEDAKTNGIRSIRLRVRADHSGIDLLPAPNRSERQ